MDVDLGNNIIDGMCVGIVALFRQKDREEVEKASTIREERY